MVVQVNLSIHRFRGPEQLRSDLGKRRFRASLINQGLRTLHFRASRRLKVLRVLLVLKMLHLMRVRLLPNFLLLRLSLVAVSVEPTVVAHLGFRQVLGVEGGRG